MGVVDFVSDEGCSDFAVQEIHAVLEDAIHVEVEACLQPARVVVDVAGQSSEPVAAG